MFIPHIPPYSLYGLAKTFNSCVSKLKHGFNYLHA